MSQVARSLLAPIAWRAAVVLCWVGLVAALLAAAASASGSAERVTVVARGLDNPRGLTVAPSGAVFVAEAGRTGSCVGEGQEQICRGFTGAITRIVGGEQRHVASRFISFGGPDGSFAAGVHDVALDSRGRLHAIMGDAPVSLREVAQIGGAAAAAQIGRLLRLGPGGKTRVSWVGGLERAKNPDRREVNPNPYSVAFRGSLAVVADAGGNAVLTVTPDGRTRLLALIPGRLVAGKHVQSVPTAVAVARDGTIFVGTLGGEGTPKGGARVWRLAPGKRPVVHARGFSNVVGLDVDGDGNLYVAQMVNDFARAEKGDFTGSLFRLAPDGTRQELAKGRLKSLGGVAVAPDGAVYVSTGSVFPGKGQVVRVSG